MGIISGVYYTKTKKFKVKIEFFCFWKFENLMLLLNWENQSGLVVLVAKNMELILQQKQGLKLKPLDQVLLLCLKKIYINYNNGSFLVENNNNGSWSKISY